MNAAFVLVIAAFVHTSPALILVSAAFVHTNRSVLSSIIKLVREHECSIHNHHCGTDNHEAI